MDDGRDIGNPLIASVWINIRSPIPGEKTMRFHDLSNRSQALTEAHGEPLDRRLLRQDLKSVLDANGQLTLRGLNKLKKLCRKRQRDAEAKSAMVSAMYGDRELEALDRQVAIADLELTRDILQVVDEVDEAEAALTQVIRKMAIREVERQRKE